MYLKKKKDVPLNNRFDYKAKKQRYFREYPKYKRRALLMFVISVSIQLWCAGLMVLQEIVSLLLIPPSKVLEGSPGTPPVLLFQQSWVQSLSNCNSFESTSFLPGYFCPLIRCIQVLYKEKETMFAQYPTHYCLALGSTCVTAD